MSKLRTCAKRVGGLAVTTLPEDPLKFFSPHLEKCVRQFKKFGPLLENSWPHMMSQAGYGPTLP